MNPTNYFQPLLGESLLYPGQAERYRGQCPMPVMLWVKANGVEPPAYASAYQYYELGVPGYTKIPVGAPILEGDIVVYGPDFPVTKGDGHIDVASQQGVPSDYWAYDSNWSPLVLTKTHHNGSDNQYIIGYLRKEVMEPTDYRMNAGDIENCYMNEQGRKPTQEELDIYTGQPWKQVIQAFWASPERKAWIEGNQTAGYVPFTLPPLFTKQTKG